MGMVNLESDLHKRLKKLAIDTGTTLGTLVHKGMTNAADILERSLQKVKDKNK